MMKRVGYTPHDAGAVGFHHVHAIEELRGVAVEWLLESNIL